LKSEQYISILFRKYLANNCTQEEAAELVDIIRSGENKPLIESLIGQHLENETPEEFLYEAETKQVFQRLDLKDAAGNSVKKTSWISRSYLKVAAAAVIIIGASVFAYTTLVPAKKNTSSINVVQDVAPGSNKATLFLSNGKQVDLNNLQIGNVADEGGVIIKKSAEGQLAYSTTENSNSPKSVNTVKTPKGGQYQVILPDGSKVWLNAASSITYPASFSSAGRHVILTGEGYFEIKTIIKNKKKVPFVVESGKQKIEVLGTRFNVNAYDDEKGIKTTLIEGKVKVTTENETVILKPNQEFNLQAEGISTKKVDAETAIDWTNGDFIFAEEDIKSVMRKIGRWYNVEVVYDNEIPAENLSGQISRNRNLSEVLRMLELSGDKKFRIENGSIHISYTVK